MTKKADVPSFRAWVYRTRVMGRGKRRRYYLDVSTEPKSGIELFTEDLRIGGSLAIPNEFNGLCSSEDGRQRLSKFLGEAILVFGKGLFGKSGLKRAKAIGDGE